MQVFVSSRRVSVSREVDTWVLRLARVRPGDSGRLSKWSPFTSSLQRNDLESLIVRAHCKLELWDDDDGIDNMQPPDIVIDNTVNMQIF